MKPDELEATLPAEAGAEITSETLPVLAQFRLLAAIGHGAMGLVFEARDTRLNRHVAIKLLSVKHGSARLLHEAQAAAAIVHPNVATVFEVGEAEGTAFIAI